MFRNRMTLDKDWLQPRSAKPRLLVEFGVAPLNSTFMEYGERPRPTQQVKKQISHAGEQDTARRIATYHRRLQPRALLMHSTSGSTVATPRLGRHRHHPLMTPNHRGSSDNSKTLGHGIYDDMKLKRPRDIGTKRKGRS